MAVTAFLASSYSVTGSDGAQIVASPESYGEWGLFGLIGRHAHHRGQAGITESTLIIDALVHDDLELPATAPEDGAQEYAGIVAGAAQRGWQATGPRAWITFRRPEATVHVLFEAWSDERTGWLADVDGVRMLRRLEWWRAAFGVSYSGTPGYAGAQAMRQSLGTRRQGVTWQPKNSHAVEDWGGAEIPYLVKHWSRPPVPGSWEHGYDLNLAYLAAAQSALLSPHPLIKTGRLDAFDPALSGWWLVDLEQVSDAELLELLPDPAGYGRGVEGRKGRRKWVATPTLKLIDELHAAELHGGYRIVDSYTAVGRPLLKRWADTARDALSALDTTDGRERDIRRHAVKLSVIEGVGMLRSPGGISRPDWHATVVSLARTALWRKLRHAYDVTKRSPLRIATDCVWYPSDIADPVQSFPGVTGGRPLVQLADRPDQLGRFKVEGSIRRDITEEGAA